MPCCKSLRRAFDSFPTNFRLNWNKSIHSRFFLQGFQYRRSGLTFTKFIAEKRNCMINYILVSLKVSYRKIFPFFKRIVSRFSASSFAINNQAALYISDYIISLIPYICLPNTRQWHAVNYWQQQSSVLCSYDFELCRNFIWSIFLENRPLAGPIPSPSNNYFVHFQMPRAKKVGCDCPGLVDFAIMLVNSVFNLPDRQVMFFEEFKQQNNREVNSACQNAFGASWNDVWASKC